MLKLKGEAVILVSNQKALYRFAVKNSFTILACHMCGLSTMKAIIEAAEEEDSPVVVQFFKPTYAIFEPLPKFLSYFRDFCAGVKAPILINHDHTPSVEECIWALDQGVPSIMFDGSHLPFEENVAKTKQVADYAHKKGAWIEAELGSIPGMEDMVASGNNTVYTDPDKAAEFIERTACDCLAIAVGTAHGGVRADAPLEIDFDLLGRIRKAVGSEYPLVLHGAASLPKAYIDEVNKWGGKAEQLMMCTEETIEKTRHYGVAKANMDVDNFLAITGAVRKFFAEKPEVFNHVQYLADAKAAMKAAVKHKMCNVTKSSGFGSKFTDTQSSL